MMLLTFPVFNCAFKKKKNYNGGSVGLRNILYAMHIQTQDPEGHSMYG